MTEVYLLENNIEVRFQEGDVLLIHRKYTKFTPNNFVGREIRDITKCFYNHAGTVVEFLGALWVAEAVEDGFYATKPLKELIDSIGSEYEILVKRPFNFNKEHFYERTSYYIAANYDYAGTLLFQYINFKFGKWYGPKGKDSEKKVNCSEVVARIYKEAFDDAYKVAPVHIYLNDKDFYLIYESNSAERLAFHIKKKSKFL